MSEHEESTSADEVKQIIAAMLNLGEGFNFTEAEHVVNEREAAARVVIEREIEELPARIQRKEQELTEESKKYSWLVKNFWWRVDKKTIPDSIQSLRDQVAESTSELTQKQRALDSNDIEIDPIQYSVMMDVEHQHALRVALAVSTSHNALDNLAEKPHTNIEVSLQGVDVRKWKAICEEMRGVESTEHVRAVINGIHMISSPYQCFEGFEAVGMKAGRVMIALERGKSFLQKELERRNKESELTRGEKELVRLTMPSLMQRAADLLQQRSLGGGAEEERQMFDELAKMVERINRMRIERREGPIR